ncbi:MAG: hypothetical protein D6744_02840 [Planctomycetota bacterium]|nr:MAG: hypothetical protein D6744_02840 [Planctomycetota bacterium]
MSDRIKGAHMMRLASVEITRNSDDDVPTFTASLSSEEPARQFFGLEILQHTPNAINLDRAETGGGLSLLFNHDRDRPLGRVRNIRLDRKAKRLRGDFVFTPHDDFARRVQADVEAGFMGDVSIAYEINDYEVEETDAGEVFRVTNWTPLEASIVTVPADPSVGVGRAHSNGADTMPDKAKDTPEPTGDNIVVDFSAARNQGLTEGQRAGIEAERKRVQEIVTLFASIERTGPEYTALRDTLLQNGASIEQAQRELLLLMSRAAPGPVAEPQPDPEPAQQGARVQAGADSVDKLVEGATRALEFRGGLIESTREVRAEMRENEFAGFTLVELARECLRAMNVRTHGMSRDALVRAALRPDIAARDFVGHGSSVFTNLLENIANKALLTGYDETPETWQAWVRIGSLPDYRQASRAGLSSFSDLDEIPENGPYKHGTMDDRKETIQAAKFGKLFALSREAILNDDLDGFAVVPRRMGRAAARKVGDKVYDILNNPPTLNQDNTSLFRSSNTGTAGAPSVTTISEGRVKMALQTDQNGVAAGLNIRPAFIIVPVGLEDTVRVIVASERDPSEGTTTSFNRPNPIRNIATVISDPRLDAASTTAWYMAASPQATDTVEVGFVNGMQEPQLESRDGWTTDGIEWKVRHEFGVAALDFRGMFKNAGA